MARALQWATEEEIDEEERAVAALQSPEIDPFSGLTTDDVLYLLSNHPPDSELGSTPGFWEILGPLYDTIFGSSPARDHQDLFDSEAA